MSQIERLKAGIIASHKQGDTKSVRILGQELRRLQAEQQSGASNKGFSFGSRDEQLDKWAEKHPWASKAAVYLSGVPFVGEYADEGIGKVMGALGPNSAETNTDAIRAMLKREQRENPISTTAIKMGSGVVNSIPAALVAAPSILGSSIPMAGKLAIGAGVGGLSGGIEGLISGYGRGTDPESRARLAKEDGMMGTAVGAGLGFAAPLASAGIGKAVKSYKNWKSGVGKGISAAGLSDPSFRSVSRALEADDAFSGAGARRIDAAGPNSMIADAGLNTGAVLDASIAKVGPGASAAKDAIEQRAAQANRTIISSLDDNLGAPIGINQAARDIAESTRAARQSAYDIAYSKPIEYGGAGSKGAAILDVLDRVPKKTMNQAIELANDAMQEAGKKNMQILASIADDGTVTFSNPPNVMQLDYIKRALGEVAESQVDQFGRKTGAGLRAARLARELRDSVKGAVDEYGTALKLGGDKIAEDNALRLGTELFNRRTTREMVRDGADGLEQNEVRALARGLRMELDEKFANIKKALTDGNMDAREARDAIKEFSSRANKEKLVLALGEEKANSILKVIDQQTAAFELRAATAQNSKTFQRSALDEDIRGVTEEGVVNAVKSVEPLNLMKRIGQSLMGGTKSDKIKVGDKIHSEIVQYLTTARGPQAKQALRDLATIIRISKSNEEVAERLSKTLTIGAGLPLYQAGTTPFESTAP